MNRRVICRVGLFFLMLMASCFTMSSSATAGPAVKPTWFGPEGDLLPFGNAQEVEQFLSTADVVKMKGILTGTNRPLKLLMETDGVRANAIYRFKSKTRGRHFRDSYVCELVAYRINKLLGMNNMSPTVLRELYGRRGTVQLWLEKTSIERDRRADGRLPPSCIGWNHQAYDMRIFDNLINNTDRNQGNILIDENWKMWLIDHTRSFSAGKNLPHPEKVTHCSRRLFEAIKDLDETVVREILHSYLRESEVKAFFVRRTKLIALIEERIEELGEEKVLF